MRKLKTRILSMLLALLMVGSIMPSSVLAQENELAPVETIETVENTGATDYSQQYVVLSLEGLTIGQGYYIEPQKMSFAEIGEILADTDHSVDDLSQLTAAQATYAFFVKEGLEIEYTGTIESGFYLSQIKGIDTTQTANIPEVIANNIGEVDPNEDADLGEFDYTSMSGWMITNNHALTPVGAADVVLLDDNYVSDEHPNVNVIRWQFSVYGYGADLGLDNGWGGEPYYTAYDKSDLYMAYADAADILANRPETKAQVMATMTKVDATEAEIADAISAINAAVNTKKIQVNVYDYTAVAAGLTQASDDGVILESSVIIDKDATADEVIEKACTDNGISYTLEPSYYGGNYVSMINGLSENDGEQYSGWMLNYNNDDFTNMGLSALTLKDGDVLEFHYSNNGLGTDLANGYSLPLLKTLKVGNNSYTLGSETTYDKDWNAITTYTINDGTGDKTLAGAGTAKDPFVIPVEVMPNTDVTKLTATATTVADPHYVTVTGLDNTVNLTNPLQVTVQSKGGNTAYYQLSSVEKVVNYSVNYNKNATNATGTMNKQQFTEDVAANLTKNTFKRTGYTFAGWTTSATGKVVYKNAASVKNLTAAGTEVTLYAVWTPITYKVAFYDNSKKASGKMSTMTLTYDKEQKLTANKFKLKGYDFAGWATSAKGKVKYKNAASLKNLTSTAGKTIKLYAKWTKTTVKTATISSVRSNAKKAMTVKWKKVSGADGYVISYSTDKNMKKSVKKVYVSKGSTTSQTIKKLKAGKKYYVTVKAYEKDSAGQKVLGKCKAAKTVKVKK